MKDGQALIAHVHVGAPRPAQREGGGGGGVVSAQFSAKSF